MNVLIDTNVILDALMRRTPFNVLAERLFLAVAEDKLKGSITASSVTDIYYLFNKHIHDTVKAREALSNLFSLFEILDVTQTDCEKALTLPLGDYEDALIVTCAKRRKAELIITRNPSDFKNAPITVITPDDFFNNYF
ncbi:type II toxin-antitoxin system VapC family toxin [Desulfosporosinus sp. SYSU MS00001]|uniref:type II toxin-antitoxin system VapC family toxin n=1 Tax=Desulfosporosinus sp. SYSU MS00001 TaxID=3416284 RepID=UPI003CF1FFE9